MDNWIQFHKLAHRLLEAPTGAITELVQDEIVAWLKEIKELRAAKWFEENWTGEFGNYTNATAGYVAFKKASGIEGNWRYMLRDTFSNSGTNKRMSIGNFVPRTRLVQYIRDCSKNHAAKIVCPTTSLY